MTTHLPRPAHLALAVALLWPLAGARAADKYYLDIPGVPGGSVDAGHRDQIDLRSFSWAAGIGISRDATGKRTVGMPVITDINWSTPSSLPSGLPLFSQITAGTALPRAAFQIADAGNTRAAPWLQLTAGESYLSSWTIGGSSSLDSLASLNTAQVSLSVDLPSRTGTRESIVTTYDAGTGSITGPKSRDPSSGPATAPASTGLFLRLGSGDTRIAGDNTSLGHEHWIAIDSYATSATLFAGAFGSSTAAKPNFTELTWSQSLDATAPVVLRNLLAGENIGQATLERVIRGNDGRAVTVMQLALTDVLFSSFSLNATAEAGPSMAATLSFGGYSQTSWMLDGDGNRIGPFSIGYDLERGVRTRGALAEAVAGFGAGNLNGTEVFNPPPIPEPQTWALMLSGLAGVLLLARRRGTARA